MIQFVLHDISKILTSHILKSWLDGAIQAPGFCFRDKIHRIMVVWSKGQTTFLFLCAYTEKKWVGNIATLRTINVERSRNDDILLTRVIVFKYTKYVLELLDCIASIFRSVSSRNVVCYRSENVRSWYFLWKNGKIRVWLGNKI